MSKKRFCSIGDTFIAIHYQTKKVYMCRDNGSVTESRILTGKKEIRNIEEYTNIKDIDEATFVAKFSDCVAKLHSQTPYA